ncbi:glutathione S-transferase C-terminal-like protein [Coniophora puteana RWD-64-598 SS2]|uniref:Glutathione S-transferase C-terminal-like protein n=1 Tax=Coniophora puteana (strain RWD-64-598) TaxID=741705 RepID=A0A5M3MEP5_CONPW|nr:glutathione S-transferase C-terminal-like protein [Coniophora puteana RWD-64-598 SS2]EIW77623.1 glutathione S-transferase C-terminal-like protein [Coniophora puteana RWD-64-598 SS2]
MSHQQLTFYGYKTSANALRVAIALTHARAQYTYHDINLTNKPEWFTAKVNPAGKIPAITIGGPPVPADQPSPDSTKLAESLVLLELIADLYPSSGLMPSDPVQRAKVRFFVQAQAELFSSRYVAWFIQGKKDGWKDLLDGARALQGLLPESGEGYAVGDELTIADCALAPFWARTKVCYERGIGMFDPEEAKLLKDAMDAPEMARFRAYTERLMAHPSVQENWDEAGAVERSQWIVSFFKHRIASKQ